jgi:glycosyltransferase involved in cell wall biosynthesis
MWKPDISVILPIFNEEKNLPVLIPQVVDALKPLDKKFEILLIDDGSTDNSFDVIKELSGRYMEVRYIKFKNNAGQSAAFDAGFRNVLGEIIITMDADLQNDPFDIPKLLSFIPEYDVVCGWRADRKDTFIKKISSWVGNNVRNFITNENIHDTGCSLKAYKRIYLEKIKLYRGMHRFLPTLLKIEGARICEVKVNHSQRKFGKSKYNINNRMFSGLYDCLAVRWMQKRKLNYEIGERS